MRLRKTGTTNKARKNDAVIDKITVMPIPPTNSALGPFPATMGKKANAVVAVAAANGIQRCCKLRCADALGGCPDFLLNL